VPAGCIAQGVSTGCDGSNQRDTFAFGLSAIGTPPVCSAVPTTDTTLCATSPADGFDLAAGQAIVFVYTSSSGALCPVGFSIASAGFFVDTNGANPLTCSSGTVVGATAGLNSAPAPPGPCPLCDPAPASGCFQAGDGNVVLKDASNDASDLLTYHWLNGSAVSLSNYGDPTSGGGTAYAVCVYASPGGTPQLVFDAEIPAGGTCGGGPCWSASASGFDYADSAGSNDGITSVLLRAGSIQASKVTVSGHGVNLPMPTPADPNNLLYQAPLATVQVINSSGSCWQSVFPGPATQMTATLFKDKL